MQSEDPLQPKVSATQAVRHRSVFCLGCIMSGDWQNCEARAPRVAQKAKARSGPDHGQRVRAHQRGAHCWAPRHDVGLPRPLGMNLCPFFHKREGVLSTQLETNACPAFSDSS